MGDHDPPAAALDVAAEHGGDGDDGIVSIRSTKRISTRVGRAPEVAGDGADQHAERAWRRTTTSRAICSDFCAPRHGEGEVVGPEAVGAERVGSEGQAVAVDPGDEVERGLDVRQRPGLALVVVVPDVRGEDEREEHHQPEDDEADDGRPVPEEAPDDQLGLAPGLDGELPLGPDAGFVRTPGEHRVDDVLEIGLVARERRGDHARAPQRLAWAGPGFDVSQGGSSDRGRRRRCRPGC